jgi:ABC-type dipeptide/oligopeptide/nickel transport system permease component
MLRFIVARLGVLIPTFIGVTIVAFKLIRLIPGDPIELLVGNAASHPSTMPCCASRPTSPTAGHFALGILHTGVTSGDDASM